MIVLENHGFLPTYTSQKALEQHAVRPIRVEIHLSAGVNLISGQQNQEIGHLEGRSNKLFGETGASDYRSTVEWVVQASLEAELQVIVISERAGTVRTALMLNSEYSNAVTGVASP